MNLSERMSINSRQIEFKTSLCYLTDRVKTPFFINDNPWNIFDPTVKYLLSASYGYS